jgi:hypothetical protein
MDVIYLNLGFSWFMVLMSIWGYIAILRNKQQRWGFWAWLGFGWAFLGISHLMALAGMPSTAWQYLTFRIAGYVFQVIAILSLMIRAVNREW